LHVQLLLPKSSPSISSGPLNPFLVVISNADFQPLALNLSSQNSLSSNDKKNSSFSKVNKPVLDPDDDHDDDDDDDDVDATNIDTNELKTNANSSKSTSFNFPILFVILNFLILKDLINIFLHAKFNFYISVL